MSTCPKCKKTITELNYKVLMVEEGTFNGAHKTVQKNPAPCFDEGEEEEHTQYSCPNCGHVITHILMEAEDFLEGDA